MIWQPSTDFRWVLRKGDRGTDVAALQLNLPRLVPDGVFGRKTHRAVRLFQGEHGLEVDGVAGLATQQKLCITLSTRAARAEGLPTGLLKSLMANESGFAVGAVSRHPSDAGLDIGAYQRSTGSGPGSQAFYEDAYDVESSAAVTAALIRAVHDDIPAPVYSRYLTDLAEGDEAIFKWQMAVEHHNWPVASYWIPRRGHIYTDAARDDQPAEWVHIASGGRLSTPREWVNSYIERATQFVHWT